MSSLLACVLFGTINYFKGFEKVGDTDSVTQCREEFSEISNDFFYSLPSLWNHRMNCTSLHDWPYQMANFRFISNEKLKNLRQKLKLIFS